VLQSDDTGDHLDGGRMLLLGSDDAGINLAGDSNGRSLDCELEPLHGVVVTRCRSAVSNDERTHSADIPNGPTQVTHNIHYILSSLTIIFPDFNRHFKRMFTEYRPLQK